MTKSPHRRHWTIDRDVRFLNHGSFGACPKAVLDYQSDLRDRLERQPVQFFVREMESLLDTTREQLAAFIGAAPKDLAFVPNSTTGVNSVLRSMPLERGDELLVTDHEYAACRNALDFVAARAGARVIVVDIPFPGTDPADIVPALLRAVTDRTRLALVDHVTSQTGLVMPLEEIVAALDARGVDTLVDGSHAPGMLPLDVTSIGAAYYTGNCHKWICAPKGAGFLQVRADRQAHVRPVTISHGASRPPGPRSRFLMEFDWMGTDDPTAVLSVGCAIQTMGTMLPGGWDELRARNRALALEARAVLSDALGIAPPAPEEMIGALVALPIPDGSPEPPTSPLYLDPLQDVLLERHGIEVPIVPWPAPPRRLLRVSAQLYNAREDYEALGAALAAEL